MNGSIGSDSPTSHLSLLERAVRNTLEKGPSFFKISEKTDDLTKTNDSLLENWKPTNRKSQDMMDNRHFYDDHIKVEKQYSQESYGSVQADDKSGEEINK